MITPFLCGSEVGDGMAVRFNCGETQFCQRGDSLRQLRWALGPVPNEQSNPGGLLCIQRFSPHQTGDGGASVNAAGSGLHVLAQVPIEFALHQQIQRLCQALRDGVDLARRSRPVLTTHPIPAADCLLQNALAINQRHRDAINFGLYPDILALA